MKKMVVLEGRGVDKQPQKSVMHSHEKTGWRCSVNGRDRRIDDGNGGSVKSNNA